MNYLTVYFIYNLYKAEEAQYSTMASLVVVVIVCVCVCATVCMCVFPGFVFEVMIKGCWYSSAGLW